VSVRGTRVWRRLFGVDNAVIQSVRLTGDVVVASVRPYAKDARRPCCPECGRVCPYYDRGVGLRRWRGLDLGTVSVMLEASAPRVACPEHGVRVAQVSWARARSMFTRAFEDSVAWLATQCSKTAVTELMRISWRTIGRIITRVVADTEHVKRLEGLTRLGIDEISYRKGQRYLTVVVDHDSGRLVWAAPGRDSATLLKFFDLLGADGCARIQLVSADAAAWIRKAVTARCPNATLCLDPFHIVMWATDALDEVRRAVWRAARARGSKDIARTMKGARFSLWKNPENLTGNQSSTLASIAKTNKPLYRAYLLKEQLRTLLKRPAEAAKPLLDHWLAWAQRCRIPAFVKLQRTIRERRAEIDAVLEHGLTNARVESMNTKIRLITRRAFGFHGPQALIALAMLSLGGAAPPLPGR